MDKNHLNTLAENMAISSNSFNISMNQSQSFSLKTAKTPSKAARYSPSRMTPARGRIGDNRTLSPKTPIGGDRFIPDRNGMNFDISHYLVNCEENVHDTKPNTITELVGDLANYRILSYNNKAPLPPEGHSNNLKVIYSSCKSSNKKKTSRYIPNQPEKILDAPDIKNDYYLQLIDWSSNNMLAVALKNEVYLWNALDGSINNLLTLDELDYISSLSWTQDGNFLAVGVSDGKTQLWDVTKSKRLRTIPNSEFRVSSQCWNSYILSSGSKDGKIYNHDVRKPSSLVCTLEGHSQEICGLKWSPNGRMLASGGNDNTINVWSNAFMGDGSGSGNPLFTFTEHQAAVKALSWCPWRSNCLASGGGTADRMIRIWNCQNGLNMYSVDTKSQVSAILWSSEYKELISSHGYINNELIIWKYPALTRVAELTGHTARILGMSMSPDGSTVVSLGADETLRFWECFLVDSGTKKSKALQESKKTDNTITLRFNNIR